MKAIDLTGQRFGKLTVTKRIENNKNRHAQWLCACDCGEDTVATTSILNSGHKVSCGCLVKHDLTDRRFRMLKVLERAPNKGKKVAWKCRCDCGKTAECTTSNLLRGASQSCGCVRTKHMGKGTRLYRIWTWMKDRALNPKSKYWDRYGGRGIQINQEWATDFSAFRDWAMANGYRNPLTIDRIENDGNYEPSNCQWLTREENAKKSNKLVAPAPARL